MLVRVLASLVLFCLSAVLSKVTLRRHTDSKLSVVNTEGDLIRPRILFLSSLSRLRRTQS